MDWKKEIAFLMLAGTGVLILLAIVFILILILTLVYRSKQDDPDQP